MAVEELGALTNISDIGADGVYRFPVYQTQTNLPNLSQQQLQSLYGSSQMPVFQWISKIQTGERTYDPATEGQLFKEYEDFLKAKYDAVYDFEQWMLVQANARELYGKEPAKQKVI